MIDLRALQMLVESERSIEQVRKTLTEAVSFFANYQDNKEKVKIILRDLRNNLDFSDLKEQDIFFVDPELIKFMIVPKEYKEYFLGLYNSEGYCRYTGRLVYPVRSVTNKVMGLCGWDPIDEPKYYDSETQGYNAKRGVLYGMEELYNYYISNEPVYITEGIVCCNYLRSKRFQALALLGSSISYYVVEILKRFKDRCILIPDNDAAGMNILKTAKFKLPYARCFTLTKAKDIDDTRQLNNFIYEEQLLKELKSLTNPFSTLELLRILK